MSTQTTQSDQANTTTITKIGDNNYTRQDLNNLMLAFVVNGIQSNTGINFYEFASFKDEVQGAIVNAVSNLQNKKPAIDQYREKAEASTNHTLSPDGLNPFQPYPTDYNRSAMYSPYQKQTPVPSWMKSNTPEWAKGSGDIPVNNQRPIFNLQELHKALNLIITVLPQFSQDILSTRFEFQGSYITVTDALYYLYGGIQQFHPQVTNSRKF